MNLDIKLIEYEELLSTIRAMEQLNDIIYDMEEFESEFHTYRK